MMRGPVAPTACRRKAPEATTTVRPKVSAIPILLTSMQTIVGGLVCALHRASTLRDTKRWWECRTPIRPAASCLVAVQAHPLDDAVAAAEALHGVLLDVDEEVQTVPPGVLRAAAVAV